MGKPGKRENRRRGEKILPPLSRLQVHSTFGFSLAVWETQRFGRKKKPSAGRWVSLFFLNDQGSGRKESYVQNTVVMM